MIRHSPLFSFLVSTATCPMPLDRAGLLRRKTRSPTFGDPVTFFVTLYCAAARSVIGLPERPYSHWTSSEQSNLGGFGSLIAVSAPSTYGLPTWSSARLANCLAVIVALQGVLK